MGNVKLTLHCNKYALYFIVACEFLKFPKFIYDNKLINKIAFKFKVNNV